MKKRTFRAVSWWLTWEDLKWPDDDVMDTIHRRAGEMKRCNVDTAVIFGCHFRWDFMPQWPLLHDLLRTIREELQSRNIQLFDHHSATLTHRYDTSEEACAVMRHSGPHLPWAPCREAAASWAFRGKRLNDWRMISALTGKAVYIPRYTAEEFCFNNPDYRKAYLEYVRMLIADTGIAGLMCDDLLYFGGLSTCVCKHCCEKFGRRVPEFSERSFWGNWNNPDWCDWLEMRYQSSGDFVEEIKRAVPGNFQLFGCCTSRIYAGNNFYASMTETALRGHTILNQEICGDHPGMNSGSSVPARLAASSHHVAVARKGNLPILAIGYGFYPVSAELMWGLNCMEGINTWFSTLKGRLGLPKSILDTLPDDVSPIRRAFQFEQAHPELFGGDCADVCGVYFSHRTRVRSYFGAIENGATEDYRRTLQELIEANIPVRTVMEIPDDPLELPIVILPGVTILTEEERAELEAYRAAGGVLLVTGPDSNDEFPSGPEDLWNLEWLKEEHFQSAEPDEWNELKPRLWRNRARTPDCIALIEKFRNDPVRILSASGYAGKVRAMGSKRFVLPFLALDYDVVLNEKLEAMRKHHSRVRVITEACPRNVAEIIRIAVPEYVSAELYFPFGGNGSIIREEKGLVIHCRGNPAFFILKLDGVNT